MAAPGTRSRWWTSTSTRGSTASCRTEPLEPLEPTDPRARGAGPLAQDAPAAALAVIVPVYNEAPALAELHRRLSAALEAVEGRSGIRAEVIAVDDGSSDGSPRVLEELSRSDPRLRVIHLRENRGQHEAVLVGFEAAHAPLLISIDADLQNPPEEIPRIVEALRAGHDLVATRRVRREDTLGRRVVSRLANATTRALTRAYTRVPLHDVGCMLRGYRRDLVERMLEAAREPGAPAPFIPALALRAARNPCEVPVAHAPRAHGRSRYGVLGLLRLQARLIATLARGPRR